MVKITLFLDKSVEQNAEVYFEKSKKAKRKLEGIQSIIERSKKELVQLEHKWQEEQQVVSEKKERRKQQWYEKFRWFVSSEGLLVVGGRDATTNEILIKKHLQKDDLVFHTDMAGSPFFIIKAQANVGPQTIQEAANATCSFSRAWKLGLGTVNTFWVKPEQVSKEANPGEYMGKGAFMIRGKTNYVPVVMDVAVGMIEEGRIMAGPLVAVKAHCKKYVQIAQGNDKPSDTAKKIRAKLGGDLDEIIRALPAGDMRIVQ